MKSTLTIRKDRTGKMTSVTATGKYAMELFKSMQTVTVATPPTNMPADEPAKL